MDYTNFNMRLDNGLRAKAYPVLEQYGLTPSQAVRMFFNQIGETGQVPLSFDWASKNERVNAKTQAILDKGIAELESGRGHTFNSVDALVSVLDANG